MATLSKISPCIWFDGQADDAATFYTKVFDGRILRTGPEVVPSSETSSDSYGYAFVDTSAAAETFYRYTVWAVTEEGLLTRAFAATLDTGRIEGIRPHRD